MHPVYRWRNLGTQRNEGTPGAQLGAMNLDFLTSKPWVFLLYCNKTNPAFPGGASGKESTCQYRRHKRRRFGKIPWSRPWQPIPVFLPGESHGQRRLAGYSPRGRKESDTTEQLLTHTEQNKRQSSLLKNYEVQDGDRRALNQALLRMQGHDGLCVHEDCPAWEHRLLCGASGSSRMEGG